jgi:hypothetical protein
MVEPDQRAASSKRVIVGLLLTLLLLGSLGTGLWFASTRKARHPAVLGDAGPATIPPIDAAAPAQFETATFSLG